MAQIPADVAGVIAEFAVECQTDLMGFIGVSHAWRTGAMHVKPVWDLVTGDYLLDGAAYALRERLEIDPDATITLSCDDEEEFHLDQLVKAGGGKRIRRLQILLSHFVPEDVIDLVNACPNLVELDICDSEAEYDVIKTLENLEFPHLTTLKARNAGIVLSATALLSHVTDLDLSQNFDLDVDAFGEWITTERPKLTRLDLSDVNDIHNSLLESIGKRIPTLVELRIASDPYNGASGRFTVHGLSKLHYLENLKKLSFGDTSTDIQDLADDEATPELLLPANLEELEVTIDRSHVVDALVESAKYLTRLKSLDLSRAYTQVKSVDVEDLVCGASQNSLEVINLSRCTNVDDAAVEALCKLPNLKVLDLNYCDTITSRGFKQLAEIPSLKQLNVKCCSQASGLMETETLRIVGSTSSGVM